MSGGCTNCGAKAGCDHRKGGMLEVVDQVMMRLYPSRRWGEPDDAARFAAGIDEEDGQALAEEIAGELDAATFFRRGGPEEYCDYFAFKRDGIEKLAGQVGLEDKLRRLTNYPKKR